MRIIKILKSLYRQKDSHFISVEYNIYRRFKWLIRAAVSLNCNYKPCEIYRKRYKSMNEFVVVGLRYNGKNVKRRTIGFAKDFVEKNRNSKCLYCETKLNMTNATTDHIIPISNGGNNCQVNLIVCCKSCNAERGNMDFKSYLIEKNKRHKNKKVLFI
jgi:5-methylcytosine-specific restriction enzyme A